MVRKPDPVAPNPFRRYDPAQSGVEYRHVDPRTGLIVPSTDQRKARA